MVVSGWTPIIIKRLKGKGRATRKIYHTIFAAWAVRSPVIIIGLGVAALHWRGANMPQHGIDFSSHSSGGKHIIDREEQRPIDNNTPGYR